MTSHGGVDFTAAWTADAQAAACANYEAFRHRLDDAVATVTTPDSNSGPGAGVTVITEAGNYWGTSGSDQFDVQATSGVTLDAGGGADTAWIGYMDGGEQGLQYVDSSGVARWYQRWYNTTYGARERTAFVAGLAGSTSFQTVAVGYNSSYNPSVSVQATFSSLEHVNVTGGTGSDTIVYMNGTRYLGGDGYDEFLADWSGQTTSFSIDPTSNAATATTLANGGGRIRAVLAQARFGRRQDRD